MVGVEGVATAAQLRERGTTPGAVRRAVAAGTLVVVRRGVYCDAAVWQATKTDARSRHRIDAYAAWLSLGRRGWAAEYSAATILALPVPQDQLRHVTMSLAQRTQGRRRYPGLRLRSATVAADDVAVFQGVPTTLAPRTTADVSRAHGFAAGLAIGDAAMRAGFVDSGDLVTQANRMRGWPGSVDVTKVATHVSAARESPAESASYALFVDHGLDLPECNPWVIGEGYDGVRCDFRWRRYRLVGEVDGWIKYINPLWRPDERVLVDEKVRQLRIEEAGYVVVRWTALEAARQPALVLDRIARGSQLAARMYGVPVLSIG